ncbi:MAG: SRPBCC domain-containing protein [Deltaproteobacteria bacterium]|nr:MAG: SRPBCC domain-containing protein [Deltaproteobacteria bacterium]TMB24865.1 MAG: SRPBCC domain-containing protein [Deltaproteobacteria bacterium]
MNGTSGQRGAETLVTIELHERGRTTELVLTHEDFETVEACDRHRQGWSSSLDCLYEYLSDRPPQGPQKGA